MEIYEVRDHLAGNCHDASHGQTMLHTYGPHLFHTNDVEVWEFLSRFTEWIPYHHKVVADTRLGRISIPYNQTTVAQLGRELTDEEIRELIFVEYSEKQWGVPWAELPAAIKGRVPARRENADDGYFTDKYQAQPKEGYTRMFERMLEGIPVHLGVGKEEWRKHVAQCVPPALERGHPACAGEGEGIFRTGWKPVLQGRQDARPTDLVIYTGKIDEYFGYCYGRLPYRSLRFEHYQSAERLPHAVINQCNAKGYTRIYDHQYFSGEESPSLGAEPQAWPPEEPLPAGAVVWDARSGGAPATSTIITKEYPQAHDASNEPFYPMPFGPGMEFYQKYKKLAEAEPRTIFLGRLATYSYLDMWMAVKQAMVKLRPIVGK